MATNNNEPNIPTIAITTNNSNKLNPALFPRFPLTTLFISSLLLPNRKPTRQTR